MLCILAYSIEVTPILDEIVIKQVFENAENHHKPATIENLEKETCETPATVIPMDVQNILLDISLGVLENQKESVPHSLNGKLFSSLFISRLNSLFVASESSSECQSEDLPMSNLEPINSNEMDVQVNLLDISQPNNLDQAETVATNFQLSEQENLLDISLSNFENKMSTLSPFVKGMFVN